MSNTTSFSNDNFEDILFNSNFYSSSNAIDHVDTLRNSINIKNSISSTSINKALSVNEKTNFMKTSPSIKALESILNEKNKRQQQKQGSLSTNIIEEGEEDEEQQIEDSQSHMNNSSLSLETELHRASTYSVQTFETAKSHESVSSNRRSFSTIEEGYSANEDTPVLSNPAIFHTIKQSTKEFHPEIKIINESNLPFDDEQLIKTSHEQDDTLIEEKDNSSLIVKETSDRSEKSEETVKIFDPPQSSTKYIKAPSMIPYDNIANVSNTISSTPNSLKSLNQTPKPLSKQSLVNPMKPSTPKKSSSTFQPPKAPLTINDQIKKSPHTRSNSTFSLSFNKDKEQPPLPGKHKRSNTLGDLSKINHTSSKTSEKKKFSFKSLFKSKSKNHSLNELKQDDASQPKKINAKSFSISNLSAFNNDDNNSMSTAPDNGTFKVDDKKKLFNNGNKKTDKLSIQLEKQQQDHMSSNSLLNVFRKNKSSDTLSKNNKNVEQVPREVSDVTTLENRESVTSNLNRKNSIKSNSNINLIREVSDDDYIPKLQTPTIESTEIQNDIQINELDDEEYDSKNLINNPPIKISYSKFDEEISLDPNSLPNPSTNLDEKNSFGSPFQIDYSSDHNTPRIPDASNTLNDLTINSDHNNEKIDRTQEKKDDSKIKDQLLGDALFPKSLSVQEVESIVSLERSRSMKSIKSNKRNSFINYNGSDENIIHYLGNGQNPSSGISRSNSILKKSNSKRSLNVQESSMANIDDTLDNSYQDLIEFTDFIDVDNLSFSASPNQLNDKSPRQLISSNASMTSIRNSGNVTNLEQQPHILSTPPPSKDKTTSSLLSPSPHITELHEKINAPLTPNLDIIETSNIPSSPESIQKTIIESSPILETAYRTSNSPILNEDGKNIFNSRPISMSFRGLKGPSFGNKLSQHNLRSSDSHQSFNISFGDDDTDYSDSGIGDGFGSSDEDEAEDEVNYESEFDSENKENQEQSHESFYKPSIKKFGSISNDVNKISSLPLPQSFGHNKIPSISDSSYISSPKSLGSIISRKWKKSSPNVPSFSSPKVIKTISNGVRFSSRIILYDTYNGEEYDRHPDTATCNQLTPLLAQQIKEELNTLKSDMEIHEDSRCYTHFF